MKTCEDLKRVIERHKEELRRRFKVRDIGIFGSYVRRRQGPRSDVDVLVEFEGSVSVLDLVRLENFLTSLLRVTVDVVPKDDLRPELKEKILKETIYV